jgi:hypothetical protein
MYKTNNQFSKILIETKIGDKSWQIYSDFHTTHRNDLIFDVWIKLIEKSQHLSPVLNKKNDRVVGFIDLAYYITN